MKNRQLCAVNIYNIKEVGQFMSRILCEESLKRTVVYCLQTRQCQSALPSGELSDCDIE